MAFKAAATGIHKEIWDLGEYIHGCCGFINLTTNNEMNRKGNRFFFGILMYSIFTVYFSICILYLYK